MVKNASGLAASTASFSPRSSTWTARIGPSGGACSPNRRMSALLNGRSQAKALPRTYQVRLPCRSPSVTSGSSEAIRATSSSVAMLPRYRVRSSRVTGAERQSGRSGNIATKTPWTDTFSCYTGLSERGETATAVLEGQDVNLSLPILEQNPNGPASLAAAPLDTEIASTGRGIANLV